MSDKRTAELSRKTGETDIALKLDLDGTGKSEIKTGVGFFDHMLNALARHARWDLAITCSGDLQIDDHHTVEDIGLVLGSAIDQALGEKKGINRFADALVPLDEALSRVVVDISGRGLLVFRAGNGFSREMVGDLSTEMIEEFWRAVATRANITLHMELLYGGNAHHQAESLFKAAARALGEATRINPEIQEYHRQRAYCKNDCNS